MTRPTAEAKGVEILTRVPEKGPTIFGDGERLQQVVWNLLANAVKFTPRGGRVEVEVAPSDRGALVRVRDTGEGIPGAFLPHLFEPFRQADESPGRRHAGLGLGLTIARALTEGHGGTIHAASEGEGRGAVFTVKLPAGGEATGSRHTVETAHEVMGGPRATLRGIRVLVLDDDPDSNAVVAALLVGRGAMVQTALGAAEALAVLERWRPDVIVSDIAMPGEDGLAFLRELRRRQDTLADVPAIALTAFGGSDARRRLLAAGFQAHVAKPFDPVHLAAVVETAAGGPPPAA